MKIAVSIPVDDATGVSVGVDREGISMGMWMSNRRQFLISSGSAALLAQFSARTHALAAAGTGMAPVRAGRIKLAPSPFLTAQETNRRYLLSLSPQRLLHNFYVSAGLPAPAPVYGGWESQGISGHTLGHYLSACALLVAGTHDAEIEARLRQSIDELARIQARHGDGYCAGFQVERDGVMVDGKIVFEELRRGEIRSSGFDLNGAWVPLYTWHKLHAGLNDACALAGIDAALPVLTQLAGYLAGVLEALDEEQMQHVLASEHGGLNEAYADTFALTGNPRWLRMAERIYHRAVLEPLAAREDRLQGLHANTQIPKVLGLARLHELTGDPAHASAARFFHERVTRHHSYIIGGNSEREHFGPPDQLAGRITEATCEACNSYNMLKLTRHLYQWQPRAGWFDDYERVQYNHILAHQHPDTGAFVYFMPLASGARRSYSNPEDSFWCCVGSGIESHSKHSDSIWWQGGEALYLNLFIPSTLEADGFEIALETGYPFADQVRLIIRRTPQARRTLALRLPGWCDAPALALNGTAQLIERRDGYAMLSRRWRAGDEVVLTLPMRLAAHPTPGDARLLSFTSGPLVLAADLGPADAPWDGIAPALVETAAADLLRADGRLHHYQAISASGGILRFSPFFRLYERRTAVYFPIFSADEWARQQGDYLAAAAAQREMAARTLDTLYLGEMQPERDHALVPGNSEIAQWNGRGARKIPPDGEMSAQLRVVAGENVLRVTYWGHDLDRHYRFSATGRVFADEHRDGERIDGFVSVDYPLPAQTDEGVLRIHVQMVQGTGVIYELRTLRAGMPSAH